MAALASSVVESTPIVLPFTSPASATCSRQPAVHAGSQGRPAHASGVIVLAFPFAKLIAAGLLQHPFQLSIERMSGCLGHCGAVPKLFLPLPTPLRAIAMTDFTPKHLCYKMILDTGC